MASGYTDRKTRSACFGKNNLDDEDRRRFPAVHHVLGAVMERKEEQPRLLDTVPLLNDLPTEGLARGQVGTVVESLGETTLLVEFSDEDGRAYAIAPCAKTDLLVLHQTPQTA